MGMAFKVHSPIPSLELSHYRPLLQSDLEQWRSGCVAYDNQDYDAALRTFMRIGDNARMHFNIGLIFSILQDHRRSVAAFKKALELDPFFAVASFQRGVSHFGLGDLSKAYEDFDQAYTKLRGNPIINYHQLGLPFRLYEAEVLFNRGICQLYLGRIDAGLTDLYYAQKCKLTDEHDIIDQAVRDRGRNYSVYSIPPGVLFRPSESKMEQMRQFQEYQNGSDYHYNYMDDQEQTKRQNSVLLPPSAPWMQEIAKTDASYLAVPEPPRHIQQAMEKKQRPPSPEEPDPFMYDPIQSLPPPPSSSIQQQMNVPVIQTPKKNTYDPESTWKVVDRRTTASAQKNDEPHWLHQNNNERVPSIAVSEFNSTFPVPGAQNNQADYTGTLDTMSYYGDDLDEELDRVYASLNAYLTTNNNSNNNNNNNNNSNNNNNNNNNNINNNSNRSNIENLNAQDQNKRDSVRLLPSTTLRPQLPPTTTSNSNYHKSTKKKKTNIYKYISQQPSSPDAKIKIKVHYHDTRILLVPSDIMFTELLTKVRAKFTASESLRLQYKDEENVMVLMIDQDDLNMARYLSRERNATMTKHPGLEKLELWCISA